MKKTAINFVLGYLRFWAKLSLLLNKPYIIGIAGSAGKSSCRNALFALLKDKLKIQMIEGNSETGIPLGILGIKPGGFGFLNWFLMLAKAPFGLFFLKNKSHVILEMGIDDPYPPKNMEYLLTIVKPQLAISLNISATHTMQFEKILGEKDYGKLSETARKEILLKRLAEEDTKIITASNCEIGIYNNDELFIKECINNFNKKNLSTKLLSFGQKKCDVTYQDYRVSLKGTDFKFALANGEEISLSLAGFLLPSVYREVFAASILTGLSFGLNILEIKKALEENFFLPKGRATILNGIQNACLIDSSYNASKASVLSFLEMLLILKQETKRPVVFVFGDMRELGREAKEEHREVAQKLKGIVDYLYCIGPLTKEYVCSYTNDLKESRWFADSVSAGEFLQKNLPQNALVLVKGSQNTLYLEEIVKMLLLNQKDKTKLCRQDKYWLRRKSKERKLAFLSS